MTYLIIKSLHVVSVMSWFAGLIYLGRLFIYHQEAALKPGTEKKILQTQFELMQKRVLRLICNPAMIASFIFGLHIAGTSKAFSAPWFHVKFALTILLLIYHMVAANIMKKQAKKTALFWTSSRLRVFNEILTIIIIMIVFLVITKNVIVSLKATGLALGAIAIIMISINKIKK